MATFHNPHALALSQERRFVMLQRSARVLHADMVKDMAEEARKLTSGSISQSELNRRGNPFGRGKGRINKVLYGGGAKKQSFRVHKLRAVVPTPKLPINAQTGRLRSSLRIIPESYGLTGQSFRLQFTAPEAKFVLALGGTQRMVPRGFWPEMRRRFTPRNRKLVYDIRLRQLRVMYGQTA